MIQQQNNNNKNFFYELLMKKNEYDDKDNINKDYFIKKDLAEKFKNFIVENKIPQFPIVEMVEKHKSFEYSKKIGNFSEQNRLYVRYIDKLLNDLVFNDINFIEYDDYNKIDNLSKKDYVLFSEFYNTYILGGKNYEF